MECADREIQQLGFVDVVSADLLRQCAEDNRGTSSIHSHTVLSSQTHGYFIEFVRELVTASNGHALELVSFCSVIQIEIPKDHSYSIFYDSAEKEAFYQHCMFNAHWNGSAN